MGGRRALWGLWGAEFASRVGESFFQITLLWYLVETLGSRLQVGLVTMFGFLPALAVGAWAGVFVDRFDYRSVMLWANAARAAAVLALPALHHLGVLTPVWVGALAFLATSFSAFFNPARDAMIPALAGPDRLVAANSLVQSAWQFSLLVGPFLAALALPWLPTVDLFLLVSLSFAASWALVVPLPRGTGHDAAGRGPATSSGFARALRGGWRYLLDERRVFWIWVLTCLDNLFLMGPVIVGMPIYVKDRLGASGSAFALIEGTYAGGMIAATWLLWRLGARWNPLRLLFLAMIYDGLTYVPLLWVDTVAAAAIVVLVHSLGIPAITVSRLTALQGMVRPDLRGRVFGFFHLAVAGMTALSIGAVGLVLAWVPVHALFAAIGVLCALCGMAGLMIPALREQASAA